MKDVRKMEQETLFQSRKESRIKTVYRDQGKILRAITFLYLENKSFELDPAYGEGNLYRKIPNPKLKFDIVPKSKEVEIGDCRHLEIESESINSIMFDPPFTVGGGKKGIIKEKYGEYKTMEELLEFYRESLKEFVRILKEEGILVVKCMDVVSSRKNYFNHIFFYNEALKNGFTAEDLFILIVDRRMPQWNIQNQEHARKHHSYFWVFRKRRTSRADNNEEINTMLGR